MLSETVSYVVGLGLALLLTGVSFWVASTSSLWGPGVATGLVVLAIAQMGVHLVFFLHITSGPDNTNNVLALAFGVLIVFLVMIGTIWIMAHMNANMGVRPGDDEPADPARLIEPRPGESDHDREDDDARRHRDRCGDALAAAHRRA